MGFFSFFSKDKKETLDKGKVWIKATGEIRLDNYARETKILQQV